jgi:hypothetical protein
MPGWSIRQRQRHDAQRRADHGSAAPAGDRIAPATTRSCSPISSVSQIISFDSDSRARTRHSINDAVADDAHEFLGMLALQFIEDRTWPSCSTHPRSGRGHAQPSRRGGRGWLTTARPSTASSCAAATPPTIDLYISSTLLAEVVEGRNVVSFVDTRRTRSWRARSRSWRRTSARPFAPLMIARCPGRALSDFLAQRGAVTRRRRAHRADRVSRPQARDHALREESAAKARLDEELRTAYTIRAASCRRSSHDRGYAFAGTSKPCRTVSSDYTTWWSAPRTHLLSWPTSAARASGRAGDGQRGHGLQHLHAHRSDAGHLVRELSMTLAPKTAPTKFVTMVVGVLDQPPAASVHERRPRGAARDRAAAWNSGR